MKFREKLSDTSESLNLLMTLWIWLEKYSVALIHVFEAIVSH